MVKHKHRRDLKQELLKSGLFYLPITNNITNMYNQAAY